MYPCIFKRPYSEWNEIFSEDFEAGFLPRKPDQCIPHLDSTDMSGATVHVVYSYLLLVYYDGAEVTWHGFTQGSRE